MCVYVYLYVQYNNQPLYKNHMPKIVYVLIVLPKQLWTVKLFYFTRPLNVCCNMWYPIFSSRSFKSCTLQGEVSMDQTKTWRRKNAVLFLLPQDSVLQLDILFRGKLSPHPEMFCIDIHIESIPEHLMVESLPSLGVFSCTCHCRPWIDWDLVNLEAKCFVMFLKHFFFAVWLETLPCWKLLQQSLSRCQRNLHMITGKVFQQNITQSMKLPPLACLLLIGHPVAIFCTEKSYYSTHCWKGWFWLW